MRVQDIMTADVQSCTANAPLTDVAALMWQTGCGAIPVVSARGAVVGIMTDRDIAMALLKMRGAPANITAGQSMTPYVRVCHPDDDVQDVLQIMKQFGVRRVPVVTVDRHLCGIVSIDDIVACALDADAPSMAQTVDVLRKVLHHRYRSVGVTSVAGGAARV